MKSLGLVDQEVDRLNSTSDKILVLELKKLRYLRSVSFVQGTLINLMRTLILLFLLFLIFKQTITFGQFFSLYIYSFFIFGPLQELGSVINNYRDTEVSFKKFQEILAMSKEPTPKKPKDVGVIKYLSFQDVSFSYGYANTTALEQSSLSLHSGETIAVGGPSGSGKPSLVK